MALNVELIEHSFQQISVRGEQVATVFYERLLSAFPEIRPLFSDVDMGQQRKKFLDALCFVVQTLRQPEVIAKKLKKLGAQHQAFGVFPEHYPLVGAVLLETLAEFLQEGWTSDLREAWTEAYGEVARVMLDGYHREPRVAQTETKMNTATPASDSRFTPPVVVDPASLLAFMEESRSNG